MPVRGSAWTVRVGKRLRRMMIGSSHTTSAPEVTCLMGIIRPATGLQICRLLRTLTSSRSASGAVACASAGLGVAIVSTWMCAEELASAVPSGRLVLVAGAGHVAQLEKADEVNRAIEEWLA